MLCYVVDIHYRAASMIHIATGTTRHGWSCCYDGCVFIADSEYRRNNAQTVPYLQININTASLFCSCYFQTGRPTTVPLPPTAFTSAQRAQLVSCLFIIICNELLTLSLFMTLGLQCFDAVGWAAGRASGL